MIRKREILSEKKSDRIEIKINLRIFLPDFKLNKGHHIIPKLKQYHQPGANISTFNYTYILENIIYNDDFQV